MSWQSRTFSIQQKLLQLMESKEMSDVTLIVGKERESFATHTWLLSSFSEVFYAMFYGSTPCFMESWLMNPWLKMTTMSLPDDDVEAFRIFIKYMYTGKVEVNSLDNAITSIYFADKYGITCMKTKCLKYVSTRISLDNVLTLYETAISLKQTKLKSKFWTYIMRNISKIIKKENIKYVRYSTILRLASEDNLRLNSELDIYNAIVKWGKHNYKNNAPKYLRKKLKKLLHHVRFLTMTYKEFVGTPCSNGILTKDEQVDIIRELSGSKKRESNNIDKNWRKPRKKNESLENEDYKYEEDFEEDFGGYLEDYYKRNAVSRLKKSRKRKNSRNNINLNKNKLTYNDGNNSESFPYDE